MMLTTTNLCVYFFISIKLNIFGTLHNSSAAQQKPEEQNRIWNYHIGFDDASSARLNIFDTFQCHKTTRCLGKVKKSGGESEAIKMKTNVPRRWTDAKSKGVFSRIAFSAASSAWIKMKLTNLLIGQSLRLKATQFQWKYSDQLNRKKNAFTR